MSSVVELRCDAVAVRYRQQRALQAFTHRFAAGSWTGLVGPNGAGKSSLLRSMAGLVRHEGRVIIGEQDLSDTDERGRAQRIAYVPQDPLLPFDMSVSDYVLLGRTPYVGRFGMLSADDRSAASDTLELLGLGSFAARMLGTLSGGEQQRVVLARALAQHASVLLLDEPTSALDIGHQQQALELVSELRTHRGLTIVSAMHDLTLAAAYADELVMLDRGAVAARGPAVEVLTEARVGSVFDAAVRIEVDEAGDVVVIPHRTRRAGT